MTKARATDHWRRWYEIVTETGLRQGDIFRNIAGYWLPDELALNPDDAEVRLPYQVGDFIVLSPSCDIQRGVRHVLMALVQEVSRQNLDAMNDKEDQYRSRQEVLRKGYDPRRFLLSDNPEIDPPFPLSFVTFKPQFVLPGAYLDANSSGPRLRLKPPFREMLGHWAGSNLARPGIEDDDQIPSTKGYTGGSSVLRAVVDPDRVEIMLSPVKTRFSVRRFIGRFLPG